jgi:hypothetical protein
MSGVLQVRCAVTHRLLSTCSGTISAIPDPDNNQWPFTSVVALSTTDLVMTRLPILHWNDVYRVRPQKVSSTSSKTIDVTQFAGLLDDIRDQWPLRDDGSRDGLALFSGDVFAPSVDSSVTRGSHMVRSCSLMSFSYDQDAKLPRCRS